MPTDKRQRTGHTIRFEYDRELSRLAKEVATACGQDVKTAVAKDMDELDARLGCLACVDWDNNYHRDSDGEGDQEAQEEEGDEVDEEDESDVDPDEERLVKVNAYKWRDAVRSVAY